MALFGDTKEINKVQSSQASGGRLQATNAWQRSANWFMGVDKYGNKLTGGAATLSTIARIAPALVATIATGGAAAPTLIAAAATAGAAAGVGHSVKKRSEGLAGEGKTKESVSGTQKEMYISSALAAAGAGASLGAKAHTAHKAAQAGKAAQAASYTAEGRTAAQALEQAHKAKLAADAGTGTAEAAKTAAAQAKSTIAQEHAKQAALSTGQNLSQEALKQTGKEAATQATLKSGESLTKDFAQQLFKKNADQSLKAFTKEYVKANKDELIGKGIQEAEEYIVKKYQERQKEKEAEALAKQEAKEKRTKLVYRKGGVIPYKVGGKVPNNAPSHEEGGIKGKIKGSDQAVEFEGGEEIFSKAHTKKMESFMKKGDAKGLGKFVMSKMKQHRNDGVERKYLQEGDVVENTKTEETKLDASAVARLAEEAGAPFPEVTAMQWALESERGDSSLAKNHNNFFGIKYHPETAERMRKKGIKIKASPAYEDKVEGSNDSYMSFETPEDGVKAHQVFLEVSPRYAKALNAKSAEEYAQGLKDAGYATDPDYAKKLKSLLKTQAYELKEYRENPTGQNPTKTFVLHHGKTGENVEFKVYVGKNGEYNYTTSKTSIPTERLNAVVKSWMGQVGEGTGGAWKKRSDKHGEYMYVDDAQGWSTRGEKNFPEMTRMSQEELNARSERIKLNSKRSIAELEKQNAKLTSKKLEADVDQRIAKRKSDMDNAQAKYNKFMQRYNAAGSSQKLAMSGTKDKLEKELTQSKALHKAASRTRDKDVADAKRLKITEHKEGVLRELKNEINSGDLQGQDLIDAKKKADLLHFELNEMNSSLQADMTAPFGMQREEYERARLEDDYGKEDDALGEVLDQEPEVARMQSTTLDEVVIEGKKEAKADAEQELNTPLGEIDNDYLKKLLDQKDKRLEKTGLKSIVDKYGGVDALLQMTGMYAAYKVATGEMPKQERSDAWKDRMQTLKDRTQLGLSNQTKTLMQRQAERTYAMDVHNIGHMATSGQAALGALGSASMRKYESDMKMGAMDAELREKHNNEYDSALVRDEAMKQEHWKRNVYDEANRKRELKAGLIGQAVKNVRENIQYNQQYGDGSLHQQYMQSMIDETRANERSTLASQFYMMKDAGATKEEIDAAFGAEKDE